MHLYFQTKIVPALSSTHLIVPNTNISRPMTSNEQQGPVKLWPLVQKKTLASNQMHPKVSWVRQIFILDLSWKLRPCKQCRYERLALGLGTLRASLGTQGLDRGRIHLRGSSLH
jgi:hypothetical protein